MVEVKNLITNLEEEDDILKFTISNVQVSYVNALRRILLSNIPIIVFKTNPYNENKVEIEINKTRLNNELIKQRLGCIPIHIDDIENFSHEDYIIELDKKNDTNEIIYATTEDFKVKNIVSNTYLKDSDVKKIFPPDKITGDYIDIVRLRPKIVDNFMDHIKLKAKLHISNAEDDGMYNVVSLASYGNVMDPIKVKEEWEKKEKLLKNEHSDEEIQNIKQDWLLIDAKKLFIENEFNFQLKSIGIYSNTMLMNLACKILIKKLFICLEDVKNNSDLIEYLNDTMENCYKITILNEDYTVGKIIENYFYDNYFIKEKKINYISFLKKHPHDNESIIKISYNYVVTKDEIIFNLEEAINYGIKKISNIQENFTV